MTNDSVIEALHGELARSLDAGETLETFRRRIQPWWIEHTGWHPGSGGDAPTHIEYVYRTYMRTVRAARRWERALRSSGTLPYLVYSLGPSTEYCREHVAWDGLILPVDAAFWNTHAPPNGWDCKCRIRSVTRRERERLLRRDPDRYKAEEPEIRYVQWENPATGETQEVAEGIDPGWDCNQGVVWRQAEYTGIILSDAVE